MALSQYSFQSKEWSSYLLDIRRAVEKNTETYVATGKELSSMVQTTVGEVRSDFNWALMLVADSLDEQTDLLRHVVEQLEAIQQTLDSPLLTQARELFKIGTDRSKRGLYEKALQSFLQAEEKDDVYFPLQLQLGLLYLSGRGEDEDVIDPVESEKHLVLAARYATAYGDSLPEWRVWVGQARFHAGQAAYLQAKNEQDSGSRGQALTHLERALDYAEKAVEIWPGLRDGMYLRAKILALMGRNQAAIEEMERLADRDRRYLGEAANDTDFDSLRKELADLSQQIRKAPGTMSRQVCDSLLTASMALASAESAALEGDDLANLHVIAQQVAEARTNSDRMDIDVERLLREVQEIGCSLLQLVNAAVHSRIRSLREQNRLNGARITEIERIKKEYTGGGIGCLLWLLLWFGFPIGAAVLLAILGAPTNGLAGSLYYLMLPLCFLGGPILFAFKKQIGSLWRNPPLNREIASLQQTITNRDHDIAGWITWLQQWQTTLGPRSALPPPPAQP